MATILDKMIGISTKTSPSTDNYVVTSWSSKFWQPIIENTNISNAMIKIISIRSTDIFLTSYFHLTSSLSTTKQEKRKSFVSQETVLFGKQVNPCCLCTVNAMIGETEVQRKFRHGTGSVSSATTRATAHSEVPRINLISEPHKTRISAVRYPIGYFKGTIPPILSIFIYPQHAVEHIYSFIIRFNSTSQPRKIQIISRRYPIGYFYMAIPPILSMFLQAQHALKHIPSLLQCSTAKQFLMK